MNNKNPIYGRYQSKLISPILSIPCHHLVSDKSLTEITLRRSRTFSTSGLFSGLRNALIVMTITLSFCFFVQAASTQSAAIVPILGLLLDADDAAPPPPPPATLYNWKARTSSADLTSAWTAPGGDVYASGRDFSWINSNTGWSYKKAPANVIPHGLDGRSTSDIYMAATNNESSGVFKREVWHFDGIVWAMVHDRPNANVIWDIAVADNGEVYTAETGGASRFNGSTWSTSEFGGTNDYTGVHVIASDNVILVGEGGSIYQWNGSVWNPMTSPTSQDLKAVHGAAGGTNLYATGFVHSTGGTVLKYNGTTWTDMGMPVKFNYYSVYAVADDDVFIAGGSGTIYHYDGTDWTQEENSGGTSTDFYRLTADGADMIAAGKANRILRRAAGQTSWVDESFQPTTVAISDQNVVAAIAVDDAWTGGGRTVNHYDGSVWSRVAILNTDPRAIFPIATDDIWFCGGFGAFTTYWHWDGSVIGAPIQPSGDCSGMWGAATDDIWAVGGDTPKHWDGLNWTPYTGGALAGNPLFFGIWGTASNNIYAVGSQGLDGLIYHYNGTSWNLVALPAVTDAKVKSIWGSGPNDIFATVSDGRILHYNGSAWSYMSTGTTKALNTIWGTASNNVFAAGDDGTMIHYNGSIWQEYDSGVSLDIMSISGVSESAAWGVGFGNAVGNDGSIMHYGPDS